MNNSQQLKAKLKHLSAEDLVGIINSLGDQNVVEACKSLLEDIANKVSKEDK